AGDPEQGKSTILYDLVGRITTGSPWPDKKPGVALSDFVILSSEDAVKQTIKPRLLAARADVSCVRLIKSVGEEGRDRAFSMVHDLQKLDAAFEEKPFAALIVDPLNAYLPAVDTYRDNEVRSVLGPLAEWAERRRVAIIAIIHMGKNTERNALQRVLGSTAFTAAARACYLACPDAQDTGRRLFLSSKMSVAPKPPGLAFTFAPKTVDGKDQSEVQTVGMRWESTPVTITAEEALRQLTQ